MFYSKITGSGSGPGCGSKFSQNSGPDPNSMCLDPQQWTAGGNVLKGRPHCLDAEGSGG